MPFCTNCGQQVADGTKYCGYCGTAIAAQSIPYIPKQEKRKEFYDGEIHKCPNCGEVLKAFETVCSNCGIELRGIRATNSVMELSKKLEELDKKEVVGVGSFLSRMFDESKLSSIERQKISLIENFPIPNTKEDILDFMVLASSNFDLKYHNAHKDVKDISDAWLSKMEQSYKKAKALFKGESIFNEIEDMYYTAIGKKKETPVRKKEKSKTGFSSWSIAGKIAWIFLNIYTFCIPAILYGLFRKR